METINKLKISENSNLTFFRYFEFNKCVIITQPKISTRFMDHLYSKYDGIAHGGIRIIDNRLTFDNIEIIDENKSIVGVGSMKSNIFDPKLNKKEIIFLIRRPDYKLYSGLIQVLFMNDNPMNTETLLKSFALITEKSYQYITNIMRKYYKFIDECNRSSISNTNDFFVKNKQSGILTDDEIEYIMKYHEYKFNSIFRYIVEEQHLQPSCANLQQLLTILQSNKLITSEKIKLIDISDFEKNTSYFESLGISISKKGRNDSNKNLYSLVDKLFSDDGYGIVENRDLKLFYKQFIYFETRIYEYLNMIHKFTK